MIGAGSSTTDIVVLSVIILALVGAVLGFIGYYIARFLKGSIKLNVDRTSYNADEVITGNFHLLTKKAVVGNELRVSLIGEKITKRRYNGKTRTHREEIYRDDVVIDEARTYDPGTRETHAFEMKVPNMQAPEILSSGIGKTLVTVARFLGAGRSRIEWKLAVRLDAKGVDLAASKRLRLNTGAR